MNYFIKIGGEPHGPLTAEEIKMRILERGMTISSLVRCEGSESWGQVADREEFRADFFHRSSSAVELAVISVILFILALGFEAPYSNAGSVFKMMAYPIVVILAAFAIKSANCPRWTTRRSTGTAFARLVAYGTLGATIVASLVLLLVPPKSRFSEKAYMTMAMNNCRQVIDYFKTFISAPRGFFPGDSPDARTSNDVFREMFRDGSADNEIVFGCPKSPFKPDGNIGMAPDFAEAVKPGENHWAMTKGLKESDPGCIPLIFENPSEATWPPKWNPGLMGKSEPGRPWRGGKVIVGFKDGHVENLSLESTSGTSAGLKPREDGTPIFPTIPGREFKVLNVAK